MIDRLPCYGSLQVNDSASALPRQQVLSDSTKLHPLRPLPSITLDHTTKKFTLHQSMFQIS